MCMFETAHHVSSENQIKALCSRHAMFWINCLHCDDIWFICIDIVVNAQCIYIRLYGYNASLTFHRKHVRFQTTWGSGWITFAKYLRPRHPHHLNTMLSDTQHCWVVWHKLKSCQNCVGFPVRLLNSFYNILC